MKRKWRFSLRTLILLPLLVAIGIIAFDLFGVYDNSTWALIGTDHKKARETDHLLVTTK